VAARRGGAGAEQWLGAALREEKHERRNARAWVALAVMYGIERGREEIAGRI
jgi:hypothetical protein